MLLLSLAINPTTLRAQGDISILMHSEVAQDQGRLTV